MPRHVHNKDPLSKYVLTSATSKLAQSREADDSCMFPLSDPEYEPHAACENTGMILAMILAAEYIPSPLRLMLVTRSSMLRL